MAGAHDFMKRVARSVAVAILVGEIGGCSSSAPPACDLPNVPAEYCGDAHQMVLPDSLPPARGDKYGDDELAARLGFSLFFDSDMGTGTSCATCHAPELAFTDRLAVSKGKETGTRNAPTIFNAARLSVFFWDGRADSLWSQPLFPIENPIEMASTRLALAQFIAANYKSAYESVFGPLPDMSSWPAAGKPGDAAYDQLSPVIQDQVNRFFSNIGKALEAFMRKDATSVAPLDLYLRGDRSQVIVAAGRGLGVFLTKKCQSCHSGPMLTDEKFHDVGFPSLPGAAADPGQAGGVPVLQSDTFNLAGPYADPGPGVPSSIAAEPGRQGAFRTPSLRNVALSFPYGHDGALESLPAVLALHAPGLSAGEQGDLMAFLATLNGKYPSAPWNNWPIPQ
jgi:cytochrome c peroxidase